MVTTGSAGAVASWVTQKNPMKTFKSWGALLLSLGLSLPCAVSAEPAADSLVENGTLEDDKDADSWPDHWPRPKAGGSWETEKDNHFIRLKSSTPGETVLLYHAIPLPQGAKTLRFSWRQRITDLKVGAEPWFDARIMLEFRNPDNQKVPGSPGAPNTRKSTDGWVSKTMDFPVPDGATVFVMMPTLFQVETGTFDLDDITLTVVGP